MRVKMSSNRNNNDDGFYKGLVYGALIGVGLAWFLGTKEGKKVKKQISDKSEEFIDKAKEKVDAALEDNFIENDQTSSGIGERTESTPNRFF